MSVKVWLLFIAEMVAYGFYVSYTGCKAMATDKYLFYNIPSHFKGW